MIVLLLLVQVFWWCSSGVMAMAGLDSLLVQVFQVTLPRLLTRASLFHYPKWGCLPCDRLTNDADAVDKPENRDDA
jgi:hypothetical protein